MPPLVALEAKGTETVMKKYLDAGEIVNTHGVKGEIKILPWTDSAEFLRQFKVLYINDKPVKILSSRVHKDCLIASLEGIDDVNAAMVLKGKTVKIDRSEAKLPKGTIFMQDIIGAEVFDENGEHLGKLDDVLDLPSGRIYVVKGKREILIPDVDEFIIKTDVEAGRIIVRLIEGM